MNEINNKGWIAVASYLKELLEHADTIAPSALKLGIIRALLKPHVSSHSLQKTTSNLSKKIQFFQTKRVLQELY